MRLVEEIRFRLASARNAHGLRTHVERLQGQVGRLQRERDRLRAENSGYLERLEALEARDLWLSNSRIETLRENTTVKVGRTVLKKVGGPLRGIYESDAFLTPFVYDRDRLVIRGCVYDSAGRRINESMRKDEGQSERSMRSSDDSWLKIPEDRFERAAGSYIYLGHMMSQYGHFLTETLSTFWALKHSGDGIPLFHHFVFGREIKDFMRPFFEAFDTDPDSIRIANGPLRLESVFIPEKTFHANSQVHEDYASIIQEAAQRICPGSFQRTRLVFLSRSRLAAKGRRLSNSEQVDTTMRELGFEVVYPETMSVRDQIELYKHTKVMAGFSGSALHNSIFLDDEATLIEFGDARNPETPLLNQVLCDLVSGCASYFVPFREDATVSPDGEPAADCRHIADFTRVILKQI